MLKLLAIAIFCLFSASLAIASPKHIQLTYDLSRNGKQLAMVKESFTQTGNQYRIESITKGIGVYALMVERVLTSSGTLNKKGLKPVRFELRQGNSAKKTLIADFDWAKNSLKMTVKGASKTEKLTAGTQDLASYAYQFMFNPPKQPTVKLNVTTGKKLSLYTYQVVARGLKIDAANNSFKTTQLINNGEDKKQLWLAEGHYYLPVRYTLTDDNNDYFEQTLTKINVE